MTKQDSKAGKEMYRQAVFSFTVHNWFDVLIQRKERERKKIVRINEKN